MSDFPSKFEKTVDLMIRSFRRIEKEYKEGSGKYSGVELLTDMLTKGEIKPSVYFKVREAIENYNTPYKIVISPEVIPPMNDKLRERILNEKFNDEGVFFEIKKMTYDEIMETYGDVFTDEQKDALKSLIKNK
jgi:hypothetical protein